MVERDFEYNRVLIFGASGSGKNWFGERLSDKSGIKFYDTDDIAWIRKFTKERDRKDKLRMLKEIARKKSWVIATGATSYIGDAVKRADLIIVLKSSISLEGYRMLSRYIKGRLRGKSNTLGPFFKNVCENYKDYHTSLGKYCELFEEIKLKYPKKIKFFSQHEKRKFLRRLW